MRYARASASVPLKFVAVTVRSALCVCCLPVCFVDIRARLIPNMQHTEHALRKRRSAFMLRVSTQLARVKGGGRANGVVLVVESSHRKEEHIARTTVFYKFRLLERAPYD